MTNASNEHPDENEITSAALPIRRDLPCIKCKYNLRGLRDGDKCPECGEAVGHTLDEVESTVLCPGCMSPNHAAETKCRVCGNALNDAGATASYLRGASGPGSTATRTRLTSVVLIYIFVAPTAFWCAAYVLSTASAILRHDLNYGFADFVLLLIAIVAAIALWWILIAVTRAYFNRKLEAQTAESETSPEDQTEPDDDA